MLFNSKVFKKVNKSIVFCSYGGPAGGGGGVNYVAHLNFKTSRVQPPPQALRFSHGRGERETSDWWWTAHFHQKRDVWVRGSLVSVFINACAYCRLFRHCHNLAEGGCLLSRFHFMHCRYFLGHVACRNLPWQGLTKCYWVIWFPLRTWQKSSSWSVLY